MKTYLTLIALIFATSIASAQQVIKNVDTSKEQRSSLLGAALPGGAIVSSAIKSTLSTNGRISMNVTVAKQTQGASFGEKVNAGLHSAGNVIANGAAVSQNPLYQGNGSSGTNPLSESKNKTISPVGPIKGVIVKGGKGN